MTSNVSQNYPYTSESEDERAASIASLVAARGELAGTLAAETTPLGDDRALVGLEVPDAGLPRPPPHRRIRAREARRLRRLRRDLREDLPALSDAPLRPTTGPRPPPRTSRRVAAA